MLTITTPLNRADFERYAAIAHQSLDIPPALLDRYVQGLGMDNVRLAYRDDEVVGGLCGLPTGQWFGGISIPMLGIAAVAVAPEHRGSGIGSRLMRVTLQEGRERGFPLSCLYASTQPLYRRLGFEPAGVRLQYEMPLAAIDVRDTDLTMAPIARDDIPLLRQLYEERARRTNGHLDRHAVLWDRLFWAETHGYGYVVLADDVPQGYALYMHQDSGRKLPDIVITDWVANSQAAARRLWTFFADHRARAGRLIWAGPPNDPALALLAEQAATVQDLERWLLRLLDVPAALASRPYPLTVSLDCHLDILDETQSWNHGHFHLQIRNGKGHVDPGGDGTVRVTANGLSALYAGYASPWDLRVLGMIDGPDDVLAGLALAFSGPVPWMPDVF